MVDNIKDLTEDKRSELKHMLVEAMDLCTDPYGDFIGLNIYQAEDIYKILQEIFEWL